MIGSFVVNDPRLSLRIGGILKPLENCTNLGNPYIQALSLFRSSQGTNPKGNNIHSFG